MKIPESAAPSYYGDEAHWQYDTPNYDTGINAQDIAALMFKEKAVNTWNKSAETHNAEMHAQNGNVYFSTGIDESRTKVLERCIAEFCKPHVPQPIKGVHASLNLAERNIDASNTSINPGFSLQVGSAPPTLHQLVRFITVADLPALTKEDPEGYVTNQKAISVAMRKQSTNIKAYPITGQKSKSDAKRKQFISSIKTFLEANYSKSARKNVIASITDNLDLESTMTGDSTWIENHEEARRLEPLFIGVGIDQQSLVGKLITNTANKMVGEETKALQKLISDEMKYDHSDLRPRSLKVSLYEGLRETRFTNPLGVDFSAPDRELPIVERSPLNKRYPWRFRHICVDYSGNGMIAESAGQYSGVAGAIPTPVYPPQIRGHIQPGYVSVPAAYYPVYPVANAPPPSGPLSSPEALPHGPPGPHGVPPLIHQNATTPLPIDFSEYMWMENEEEFDKQVMQQLEEEALMEQCIEAMLEDERERMQHNRQNGRHTNGVEGKPEVSKSTLNPLAAEFVPGGGGFASPVVTARTPSPTPESTTTASAASIDTGIEESSVESKEVSSDSSRDESPSAPEEVASPVPSPSPPPVRVQTPPVAEVSAETSEVEFVPKIAEEIDVKAEAAPAVEIVKEKSTPEPEVSSAALTLKQQREQSSRLSRRKPTMADVVGTGKKADKVPPSTVKTNPKTARSETRVPAVQPKGKDVKQVKSEPKLEQKGKEFSQFSSGQEKTSKEELIKAVHPSTEGFMAPVAIASNTSQSSLTTPKPINYAAAAKANRPQPQAQAPTKKPTK